MVFELAEYVRGSGFTLLSILKCIGVFSPKIVSTCMTSWVIKKPKKLKALTSSFSIYSMRNPFS